jgi:CHAD domain-containing protein
MRVPAAAGIAFGSDQHVLAERGELMAAERAAVRRGLAIRRAAHRPPWGRRKARGHRPIVAPSLAGALAVVGLGVGIALAKAKFERRRTPAPPRPRGERRPALLRGEPLAEGLRRVILGQLDLAIELLEGYPAEGVGQSAKGHRVGPLEGHRVGPLDRPEDRTVHEIRKAIKRLRALLRLLREELGAKRYARENAALRDCARRLAGARDAEVMVGTLEALLARHPKRLGQSVAVRELRTQLLAEREAAAAHAIRDPRVRREVAGELRAVRSRAERWVLRERGFKLLAPGLERIYRQGRSGLRRAHRRGGDAEALHLWRKRVKDLRYAAETLDRGGKATRSTRRVAQRADRLGEMLGEEHDLALLARGVRRRSERFAGERGTRKRLLKLIAQRRKRLHRRALREGERLYRRKPRRFVRRMKRAR